MSFKSVMRELVFGFCTFSLSQLCVAASSPSPHFPSSGGSLGPGDRLILQECTPEFTKHIESKTSAAPDTAPSAITTATEGADAAAKAAIAAVKAAETSNVKGATAAAQEADQAASKAKALAAASGTAADLESAAAAAASATVADQASKDSANSVVKYSAPAKGQLQFTPPTGSSVATPILNRDLYFWVDTQPDADGVIAGHFTLPKQWWNPFTKDYAGTFIGCGGAATGVTLNERYFVNTSDLKGYAVMQSGTSYGAITIPYKLHISDRSFDAAPTIAAYLGYGLGLTGIEMDWVLAGGLGSVSVPTTSNGKASTDLKTSLSIATGPVVTLTKGQRFQLGILTGIDWVAAASQATYKYNGKPWIAISLGVSLTQ